MGSYYSEQYRERAGTFEGACRFGICTKPSEVKKVTTCRV